jgi:hypothetical protein
MEAILSILLLLTQAACGFTLLPKSHAIVDPPQQNQPQLTLKKRCLESAGVKNSLVVSECVTPSAPVTSEKQ